MKHSLLNLPVWLTTISVLANVVLLFVCGWLFLNAKSSYENYRYFRALDIGTSESSWLAYKASPSENTRVVLFGDSRVQQWIPLPEIDNFEIINAGINGETTTEMRRRFGQDVLRHQPDIVVIQAGVNDLTAAVTRGIKDRQKLVNNMHANMKFYIDTVKKQNIKLVITSIIPNSKYNLSKKLFWHGSLSNDINNSNSVIENFAAAADITYLDLTDIFYADSSTLNSKLFVDTLHVNASAYSQINKTLEQLLPALINKH